VVINRLELPRGCASTIAHMKPTRWFGTVVAAVAAAAGLALTPSVAAAPTTDGSTWDTAVVPLPNSALAYDAKRSKVLVAVPASMSTLGNHLIELNPHSGALGRRVFVGSDPNLIVVSDDSSRAYVALGGRPSVAEIDLTTFTFTRYIDLVQDLPGQNAYATDIAVQPGSPGVIAVARSAFPFTSSGTVAIFDEGVRRPVVTTAAGAVPVNTLTWSDDPSMLFGFNNESTGNHISVLTVDPSGVTQNAVAAQPLGSKARIHFVGGLIHSSGGYAVDPTTFDIVGTYVLGAPYVVDSEQGKRFSLANGTLRRHDVATSALDWSHVVPNIGPGRMVDAGDVLVAGGTSSILLMGHAVNGAGFTAPPARPSAVSLVDAPRIDRWVSSVVGSPDGAVAYVLTSDDPMLLPSPAPPEAGMLAEVDVSTGAVLRDLLVGDLPYQLAISDDGSRLIVGHEGFAKVTEVDVATFTVARTVDLPEGERVNDIAPVPGDGDAYAVTTLGDGAPPALRTMLVDDGVILPDQQAGSKASEWIGFAGDASTLFGAGYSGPQPFMTYAITSTGVTWLSGHSGPSSHDFRVENALLYSEVGYVYDPWARTSLGRVPEKGIPVPAPGLGRFFIGDGNVLREYDLDQYSGGFTSQTYGAGSAHAVAIVGDHLVAATSQGKLILAPLQNDARPPPTAPILPVVQPGNEQATIDWQPPSNVDPATLTHYTVTATPGGATCGTTTTTCTMVGLDNGTTYTFDVRAHSIVGESPQSDATSPAIPAAPPSPPLDVVATPGNGSAMVSWTPPTFDGGAPIAGYTVTSAPGGASCTTSTTTCTVASLMNGLEHTFSVVAHNGASVSAPSDASGVARPTACGGADPGPFSDVAPLHVFCDDIEWASAHGFVHGYVDGTFGPTATTTRQTAAEILYRCAGSPAFSPPDTPTFTDVPVDHPFRVAIEWLAAEGVASGFGDGTFRPTRPFTRQGAAAMLYDLAGRPAFDAPATATFSDVPTDHLFFLEVEWLAASGVAHGYPDGGFHPSSLLSRQVFTALLHSFDAVAATG
jgi:hypothetical protein